MMLKRSFTKTESAILLIFVALLLALLYYQFVYKWIEGQKRDLNTSAIENEIMAEQARAAKISSMQADIESGKADSAGVIVSYNNLKAEINELNDIFKDAVDFDFGFDQAVADGDAVRRNINATFTAYTYAEAKAMLEELHNCRYRCLIKDISVSPVSIGGTRRMTDANLNNGPVSVTFTVTFFETMFEATTTDGLAVVKKNETDDTNLLNTLAASKEQVENM